MAETHVFIGTNNQGKFNDALRTAEAFEDIVVVGPEDFGFTDDVDETEDTYQGNARLKREAYLALLQEEGVENMFVVCDDSGIEIDALNGAPGIHSRRWRDGETRMTDAEMIAYAIEQLKGIPAPKRTAHFAGMLAVGNSSSLYSQDIPYRLSGTILETPTHWGAAQDGYPFRALFYLPQYEMMLSELMDMPDEERPDGFMSHREIGLLTAFTAIDQQSQ